MTNWCSTHVSLFCDSENNARALYTEFEKATASNPLETDFGNKWLGYLLMHCGYTEEQIVNHGVCHCRGAIWDICLDKTKIDIDIESARMPALGPIKAMIDKFCPNTKILYEAIEAEQGIFCSNDPRQVGRYYFDLEIGKDDRENDIMELFEEGINFYDEEELHLMLKRTLGKDGDIESLLEELEEMWQDSHTYVSYQQYQYCDAEIWYH